jgi:hypothetical protein
LGKAEMGCARLDSVQVSPAAENGAGKPSNRIRRTLGMPEGLAPARHAAPWKNEKWAVGCRTPPMCLTSGATSTAGFRGPPATCPLQTAASRGSLGAW